MYQIEFTQNAIDDVFDISDYYQQEGGVSLSEKMLDRIYSQIDSLQVMPNRCITSSYSTELKELILQKAPYKVFFKIDENRKIVFIINVIHTSRDIQSLFDRNEAG